MLQIGNKGFTLVEIMVATGILSLGLVMVYQAFFVCLDAFDYYLNHLNIQLWLDETLWQFQDKFQRYGFFRPAQTSGEFVMGSKDFHWNMNYSVIAPEELYQVKLNVSWQQGARKINLPRTAYLSNYAAE